MRFTNLIVLPLLLLLASSSCLADSQQQQHQQSVQSDQSHSAGASGAGENSEKSVANAVDKSQNKRGAPIVVGTPAQHTAYINHHVVAAPISGHATHAAIGAVPFGYGHAVTSGGHILQATSPAAAAVSAGVPQHVLHKVSFVGPATATTTTTTVKLAAAVSAHPLPSSASPGLPLLAKYNYALPQVTYAHYPAQYQLVPHHPQAGSGAVQPATIYATHALHSEHPVAEIATHHQPAQHQQQASYAHQQPIYAPHPAAIHYSLALPGQHNYAGQLQQQHQQQQQQHPLSHTQAIHYQQQQQQQQGVASNLGGQQPAVPIVHQAPIAAINQVHQAQQVYATQGQLTKYPLAATSLYGAAGLQNQIYSTVPSYAYHQHAASNGLAGKQLLPTAATPVHLKSLVPLTTATTTQHHGNGISYTAFTQPSHSATVQQKPLPQGVLQTQPSYYNAATSHVQQQQQQAQQQQQYQQQAQVYYRHQLQQQQPSQQQQQRIQIYSTVASPLQKAPILYGAGQFSHPVPSPYAAYPYGNHPQPQQQQQQQSALFQAASQQSPAALGKITYASPVAVHNAGGTGAFGGRGSIYLLH